MINTAYPIQLDIQRAWRTYLGGSLLDALHGQPSQGDEHFPEEWLFSTVSARNPGREHIKDEGLSHILSNGMPLRDAILAQPEAMLGKDHFSKYGTSMGVLTKVIDAFERLSIQVHPDRPTAMSLFNSPYGKTECWYIIGGREVDGQPPHIYMGFKEGVTAELWQKFFDEQDIQGMLSYMHRFDVQPGEVYLIEGGIPHAIGTGCLIVEIQEPTDYTVRVERITPSGFHIDDAACHQGAGYERMMECFNFTGLSREETMNRWLVQPQEVAPNIKKLVGEPNTDLFSMNRIDVADTVTLPQQTRFSGIYILEGAGQFQCNGETFPLQKGDQFFLPAAMSETTLVATQPIVALQCFGPT